MAVAGRAVWWAAAALVLCACDAIFYSATWPGCQLPYYSVVVDPGKTDESIYSLYLDSCNETLKADNFKYYPNLEYLVLTKNRIDFTAESFRSLHKLNHLTITKNDISGKSLPLNSFHNNAQLLLVSIADYDMSDAPDDLLQGLHRMDTLIINNCSLRSVPQFITRYRFPRIEGLNLDKNQISRLDDPATFNNVPNAQKIMLSDNQIEYLHVDLLKPLNNIRNIYLSGNKIRYIPEVFFQNKTFLYHIDLSNNLIEVLPAKAFFGSGLKYLYMIDNRLTYLADNFFSELQSNSVSLNTFLFYRNPWPCACLNDLLVKVKELNISYVNHIYNGQHSVCVVGDSFKCQRPDFYQNLYKNFTKT